MPYAKPLTASASKAALAALFPGAGRVMDQGLLSVAGMGGLGGSEILESEVILSLWGMGHSCDSNSP